MTCEKIAREIDDHKSTTLPLMHALTLSDEHYLSEKSTKGMI